MNFSHRISCCISNYQTSLVVSFNTTLDDDDYIWFFHNVSSRKKVNAFLQNPTNSAIADLATLQEHIGANF